MTFDEVKKCIIDFKIQNVKINDSSGKKLMVFEGELCPVNLNNKLDSYLGTLQAYGRVNFIAANETQKAQNWKDCYNWVVTFGGVVQQNSQQDHSLHRPMGFVSQTEATLMALVERMKLEGDFNKRIFELEQKLNAPKEHHYERLADKYGPLLIAMFGMKLEPDQVQQMMGWYQIQNSMNGKNPMTQQNNSNQGIAGMKSEPTIQQTKEEQEVEQKIVEEMNSLSTKISDDKILILVKALNANPAAADTLIGMINPQK